MQIYATVRRCRISERDVSWRFKTLMDRNDSFYTRRLMMVDVGSWFRLCSLSWKINQNIQPRTVKTSCVIVKTQVHLPQTRMITLTSFHFIILPAHY